jgi:hypothetical protein
MKLPQLLPILLLAACLVIPIMARAGGDAPSPSGHPWVETNFPIIAWNILTPAESPGVKSESFYSDLAGAGYNVAGFVPREDLPRAQAAGLKAILLDRRFWELASSPITPAKRAEEYAGLLPDPAVRETVIGVYLVDEPGASAFRPARNAVEALGSVAPDLWPFISFLPFYAEPKVLGFPNYSAYVQAGLADTGAWNFSGCFYGLMDDGTLRKGYWNHLATMRAVSLKNNKPFYHFMLTCPHFRYREPSDADLSFAMFSGLAYGAKGMLHFTAAAPPTGNYRLAPIDQFGKRTRTYETVQRLNRILATLGPTLLGLKSERVYFTGTAPEGQESLTQDSFVKGLDFDALVGDFLDANGRKYSLITNLSLTKSQRCDPKPAEGIALEMLCPYEGIWKDYIGERMWLAPGQGLLLRQVPQVSR